MEFILFMCVIPFLNDMEISLLTSGSYCDYILTMAILKMGKTMAKIYRIPSSIRNFCFLKGKKKALLV